jgi:hypothetical protein
MSKHKLSPGTRIRTPAGRFATVATQGVDAEGRVHFIYYDGPPDVKGDEGCCPAKLIRDCDILPAPNTHVTADPRGASDVPIRTVLVSADPYDRLYATGYLQIRPFSDD